MKLGKYSFGIGDRFGHQGAAQLTAIVQAKKELGIDITPVWNKSNREHTIVHSLPEDVRREADQAVKEIGFTADYFTDADHINLSNVDKFIPSSDFFTIDVADYIGKPASQTQITEFLNRTSSYIGKLSIAGIAEPFEVSEAQLREIASKFLYATSQAAEIYRHIRQAKKGDFVTEISMDEVDDPQTPLELFFILQMLSEQKIPVDTIAPKFTGRFNKGVDYVGDCERFEKEFEEDLLVLDYAVKQFGLPSGLKLSIHSGSDKFSIYPIMGRLIAKYDKGIHVKTAGTTWLEEAIGLALAEGEGLSLMKDLYKKALGRYEELCGPYATVIDIDLDKLPTLQTVEHWNGKQFATALRHIPANPDYIPDFRQLIHVSYKIAAEYGDTYTRLLEKHKDIVGKQVTENIFDRHIRRLF